jgi:SAM-dependent methyltransferase
MKCPVCDSESGFSLVEQCLYEANGQRIEYKIYRCKSCGSSFADPLKAAPPEYYNYSVPEWRWEYGRALQDIEKHCPRGGMILEIGCSEGYFLKCIDQAKYKVYGIDFNPDAIAKARRRGLNCYVMTLEEFREAFPDVRVDMVCFFHVLEHLESPSRFLEQVASVLKDGGHVMFSVPNPNRIRLKFGREDGDYPPHHLVRFSVDGLFRLLGRCGFQVIKVEEEPRDLNVFSANSYATYHLLRTMRQTWLYKPATPRWIKALVRIPVFLMVLPGTALTFWKNRYKGGLSVYILSARSGV